MKSAVLSAIAALEYTSVSMATLVSVITLILTGQPLTPVNVFMLVSFVNILRHSVCSVLAYSSLQTYDAYVSLGRLEEFLLLENLPLICFDQAPDNGINPNGNFSSSIRNIRMEPRVKSHDVPAADTVKEPHSPTLSVSSLTKKQIKRETEFILQDINFSAAPESLTVITGPVGSGKSVLLSGIAGEVSDISGIVSCQGTLVYVPQLPWVFSGTLRENILFGEPYDELKYFRIIKACALTMDIEQFPDWDETLVGEHGEVLSGGQRARVGLARAVYADADIYLLDDALSAVDLKVGQHILSKCIKDLLSHKIRVVASHQENLMKEADNVIVLYKGRMLGEGRFTEVKEKGILNTTVDPLYKKLNGNESDNIFIEEKEDKDEISGPCRRIASPNYEPESLPLSVEDRSIGVVSSKLYWKYFRSGASTPVIFAVAFLCLFAQGKPQQSIFPSETSFSMNCVCQLKSP